MYSVKPGRGPSYMGVFGGLVGAAFGVIWTVFALQMGAPGIFAMFGVVFVIAALGGAVYNFYNATQSNRLSHVDVTTHHEEPDPLNVRAQAGRVPAGSAAAATAGTNFCPQCGARARGGDKFCPNCGTSLVTA